MVTFVIASELEEGRGEGVGVQPLLTTSSERFWNLIFVTDLRCNYYVKVLINIWSKSNCVSFSYSITNSMFT